MIGEDTLMSTSVTHVYIQMCVYTSTHVHVLIVYMLTHTYTDTVRTHT